MGEPMSAAEFFGYLGVGLLVGLALVKLALAFSEQIAQVIL